MKRTEPVFMNKEQQITQVLITWFIFTIKLTKKAIIEYDT